MFACCKRPKKEKLCQVCGQPKIAHSESDECWEEELRCNLFIDCGDCDGECPPCCLAICNCLNCLLPGGKWERKHRRVNTEVCLFAETIIISLYTCNNECYKI